MKKIVVLIIIVSIVLLTVIFLSTINNNKTDNDLDIIGKVTNITSIENGIVMFVESEVKDNTGMDKVSVTVNKSSIVTREGIQSFIAFNYTEIIVGDIVEVKFKGEILLTYPAQGVAESVVIK